MAGDSHDARPTDESVAARRHEPVLIVGAGPAGLATAAMLQRAGIAARILEAGPTLGYSWTRYYDQLRLHTGRRISGLPGYPLPRGYPVFVPRPAYLQYLHAYARRFHLNITTNQRVLRAERVGDLWRVTTTDQVWEAPVLVSASGISSNPYTPPIPGLAGYQGRLLHSIAYHTPDSFAGQNVLVVGMGNSGTEISLDLARRARQVTLAVRSPISIVPKRMLGVPISYFAVGMSYLPPRVLRRLRAVLGRRWMARLRTVGLEAGAPDQFPVIGLEILDAIQSGQVQVAPGIASFDPDAVCFTDGSRRYFDAVVLATGFRPALEYLAGYIAIPDEKQAHLPLRAAPDAPDLYFVGQYYDGLRGQLYLIGQEAQEVARLVRRSGAARVSDAWVGASAESRVLSAE